MQGAHLTAETKTVLAAAEVEGTAAREEEEEEEEEVETAGLLGWTNTGRQREPTTS